MTSNTMVGADADELERIAQEFRTSAQKLERSGAWLTSVITRMRWIGGDASQFSGEWTKKHLPRIREGATLLRDTANDLARQANDQRQTSLGVTGATTPVLTDDDRDELVHFDDCAQDVWDDLPEDQLEWWNSLTPEQQALLARERPAWLTTMPGLPTEVHEAANDQLMTDVASDVVIATDTYAAGGSVRYLGSEISGGLTGERTEYADGSVDLTVVGDLSVGAGEGSAGVAGGGLGTATFHFDTQSEADEFLRGLERSYLRWGGGGPLSYLAGYSDNLESGGAGLTGSAGIGTGTASAGVDASVVVEVNRDDSITLTAAGQFTGAILPAAGLTAAAIGAVAAPGSQAASIGDQSVASVSGTASLNLGLDGSARSLTLSYDATHGTSTGLHGAQEVAHLTGTGARTTIDLDLSDPVLAATKDQIVAAVKRGDVESIIKQLDTVSERNALLDRATVTHSTYMIDGGEADVGVEAGSVNGGYEQTVTTSVTVKPPGGQPEQIM